MTVLYALVQFFFWFCYGTAVNYASVYLLACGLSNTAIGLITALASALSVLVQPALSSYADRDKSISVKTILILIMGMMTLSGIAMTVVFGAGGFLNGLFLGCAIFMAQLSMPFLNALATESVNAGKKLNFSIARGIGSLGYATMSFTVGRLVAAYTAGIMPYILITTTIILIVFLFTFPFRKTMRENASALSAEHGPGTDSRGGIMAFLTRYPVFAVTLAGCVLIFTGHVLINNFIFQIVVPKGGNSTHMGTGMAIAGSLELLSMVFYSRLLRIRESAFWFRISGVFFTLKSLGTLLAPNIPLFYAVQFLQPLGWGLMAVSSVYYVDEIMEARDRIKGQAYMTMALTIGTITGSLSGGVLIDTFGVNGMLAVAVLSNALGTLIVNRKSSASGRTDRPAPGDS